MGEKSDNKQDGAATFVFKVDLHCEGCAQKVKRNLKNLTGVESFKTDVVTNKVTVVGKVDPALVKKRLEDKIKKPVEFVSPKNDQEVVGNAKKPDEKKAQEKKPKEVEVVTTVVLKTDVHCDGCANKMNKILSKYKGVQSVNVELPKDQITVKGTMEVKEMLPYLSAKFKRPVELFPPLAKKSGDGGEGKSKEVAKIPAGEIVENVHKMEYGYPYYNGYGTHFYNPQQAPAPEFAYVAEYGHAPHYLHAPQMFSDENPNACSVM